MDKGEFEAAVSTTKMQPRTIEAARLVLVEGKRIVDAVEETGMKQQQINEAVRRVEAAHFKMRGTPEDWECVTVTVPRALVESVREIERQALRDAGLSID